MGDLHRSRIIKLWLYQWWYYGFMATVVKRTISVPSDIFTAVQAEIEPTESISELFSQGAKMLVQRRAALRGIHAFESEYGVISADELARADATLDAAGVI